MIVMRIASFPLSRLPVAFILLLTLLLPPAAHAQTRVMVVGDPHVMSRDLVLADGEAWQEALANDRKLNDYSQAIFDEMVNVALRERPDLLLIPGDLTKDGEWLSHQHLAGRLEDLRAAGIQSYVVPGNHDLGTDNAVYYEEGWTEDAEVITREGFEQLYRHFGYGPESVRDDGSLSYCCEPVDGLVLIGLDTGNEDTPLDGCITLSTLRWACDQARQASEAGKQVWVMMHHSTFSHVTGVEKLSPTYSVRLAMPSESGYLYFRTGSIREDLAKAGAGIVISGHVHSNDIAKDYTHDFTHALYDICTSTSAAYPCPYRMLTLDGPQKRLAVRTRYLKELPGVGSFYDMARQRLREGLASLVSNFIYDRELVELIADVYLLHTEGNEHLSPKRDDYRALYDQHRALILDDALVKNVMGAYGITADDLDVMVASVLEDKSNYGEEGHENQTDDLNLNIDLVSMETGISDMTTWPGEMSSAPDAAHVFTLQGQRINLPKRKGIYVRQGRKVVINN